MTDQHDITVFVFDAQMSLKDLGLSVRQTKGSCMVVLPPEGIESVKDDVMRAWLKELRSLHRDRTLILACKNKHIANIARREHWQIASTLRQLRLLIGKHPQYAEALRTFSPSSWRQQIRTRLQFIGLLSLPKLRIWVIFASSILVFLFAFFKLLPSCVIQIWPNQNSVNYTTNVFLVSSGATVTVPVNRIHNLPLRPLTVTVERTLTFDQVGKNFTGTASQVDLTVYNDGDEKFSLRKGTRFSNQAGMIFRLKYDLILEARTKQVARATAAPVDLYGEIIGVRGNVPAGLKWDVSALPENERAIIYARNEKAGYGGTTSYANIVKKEDIDIARKKLEQELLASAKQMVEDQRNEYNDMNHSSLVQLNYDDLTKIEYKNFNLSESFIGQNVSSIPVQGTIAYTVLLYDDSQLLKMLRSEIEGHVSTDKVLVESSFSKSNVDIRIVPPWDDDFKWVKITADLNYAEKFVLGSLTPAGATFGKNLRDSAAGKSVSDAKRIINNLPEVSKVEIKLWPPWATALPTIPNNIAIVDM
ncbi:MAG: hypothetical protein KBD00_05845 [Candidatus Peribacteraceae bacterium]|nr:hypothetical protein [Candidatus Peribacteraceae bacterium]